MKRECKSGLKTEKPTTPNRDKKLLHENVSCQCANAYGIFSKKKNLFSQRAQHSLK